LFGFPFSEPRSVGRAQSRSSPAGGTYGLSRATPENTKEQAMYATRSDQTTAPHDRYADLATARALSDLAHRLLDAAVTDIEAITHAPTTVIMTD
jgi:hypothetical protein